MQSMTYPAILRRVSTLMAVVTLSLTLLAGITGILLAFYYEPTAAGAHESLELITNVLPTGAIIRSLHNIAGNGLIGMALIQLVLMFLSRQFRPAWLTAWISGIFLILTAIGLSWTAIILDWDQIGYWRFKLELGTIEAIPVIGSDLRAILTGGSLNSVTIQHMYTIHGYILSGVALVLAIVHLAGLLWQERELRQSQQKQAMEQAIERYAQSWKEEQKV